MSKPTGPACGNNPNHPLSDGDRQAVADFKAYLTDRATAAPVKQRADCTELEWAEQERARFERLYTREFSRAETAVRDADIYQARLERLGEGYTRERKRAERAEAEAERLRTYRDATCICQHTEQQHFEDACLVCDCGDYLVPEAASEVIDRWRQAAIDARADRAAVERVRAVLETEAVVGRSALEYRGLIASALMSDEAQPAPVSLATPCADCRHTYNWHASTGCCLAPTCTCVRFQPPAEEASP